ncbi:efflux RND transporter periplasmic adaptor subunit [Aliagarivorans taiwanensis]|uniref:efflux RND transporter periplasmic adaptor subunit n=1 Tax=Aliagarivorans taiwanensis TaxID=561966 RepID=UPI00040D2032|nr:efflux RND transporter periplasmic adaptor subunit [Aliagarivorans taiwanensis]
MLQTKHYDGAPATRRLISLGALAVIAGMLSACSAEDQAMPVTDGIRPVITEQAAVNRLGDEARYFGVVQSAYRAALAFRTHGRIIDIFADEGDYVRNGDLIARLDPTDAEIALSRANIEMENRHRELKRAMQLFSNNGAIAQAQLEEIESRFLMAKNRVAEASRQLEHTFLYAHFDGVIARRLVDNHDLIQAEQSVITMHDLDSLEVVINVPARAMQQQDSDGAAVGKLRDFPGKQFELSLARFATEPDPVTHTYAVTLAFKELNGQGVLPGMPVEVTTSRANNDQGQQLSLPLTAVLPDNMGGLFVWVVNSDGSLSKRKVKAGAINMDRVAIESDIQHGEQVVIAGHSQLSADMTVRAQDVSVVEAN